MRAVLGGVAAAVALVGMGCTSDPGTAAGRSVAAGPDGTGAGAGPAGTTAGQQPSGSPTNRSNGTATGTPAAAPAPAPAGPGRCHTAALAASARLLDAGAGNRYAAVVLTNRSAHTCRIYGYGGLGLLDAAHQPLPSRQYRDPTAPPTLVTLLPGHSASALLHWRAVPGVGDSAQGPCQPQPRFLSVIPPDETDPLLVRWPGGPVCQRGQIDQSAYRAGSDPEA